MATKKRRDPQFEQRVRTYVSERAPRYLGLLKHRPSLLHEIPDTVTDLELEVSLCKHQFELDSELRRHDGPDRERDDVALAHLQEYISRRGTAPLLEHGPQDGPLILCIDDYAEAREMYAQFLAVSGFRVHEAGDGIHALHLMMQRAYDLLLLDLAMPQMDGFEVLRILRRFGSKTPVVVVTGFALAGASADVFRAHPDATFLTKPCMPDDLLQVVRDKLTRRPASAVQPLSPAPAVGDEAPSQHDRLSKALAQVVGGACHDLANSLSVVLAESSGRSSSERAASRKRILRRSFEIVQQLHRFAGSFYRPEAAGRSLIEFGHLEEHVIGVLQPLSPTSRLEVDVRVDCEQRGATVSNMLIDLVVVPLAVNSMEALGSFPQQTRPRIQVWLAARSELDELAISVTDNGPGFRDLLQTIRTMSLENRIPSRKGGTRGYGLLHLMRLVRQLGGSVELRDVPAGGAVVDVRLPLDV